MVRALDYWSWGPGFESDFFTFISWWIFCFLFWKILSLALVIGVTAYELPTRNGDLPDFCCSFKFSNKKKHFICTLSIRFLVPKIGSRRSDGPISRFRFCGENVGRSFVVCSHDPIFRTNKESSIGAKRSQGYHIRFLGAFQLARRLSDKNRACSISIRFFFQNYGSVCRKVIFKVFTRSDCPNQQKSHPYKRIVWTGTWRFLDKSRAVVWQFRDWNSMSNDQRPHSICNARWLHENGPYIHERSTIPPRLVNHWISLTSMNACNMMLQKYYQNVTKMLKIHMQTA